MSLLQASKKYRVPSRILLDKLQQKYNEDEILAAIEEIKSGMSLNKAPLVSWLWKVLLIWTIRDSFRNLRNILETFRNAIGQGLYFC